MTYELKKSVIEQLGIVDIEAAVRSYALEHAAWRERRDLVASLPVLPEKPEWSAFVDFADPASAFAQANTDWNNAVANRPTLYPEPLSHPEIVACLNDAGDPDFVVVDDGPTDADKLMERKNILFKELRESEESLRNSVIPPAKMRLYGLKYNAITTADQNRFNEWLARANEKFAIDVAAAKESGEDEPKFPPTPAPEQLRPEIDQKFMEEQSARQARIDAIVLWAAQAESDIDDLTLETIDSWTLQPFSE